MKFGTKSKARDGDVQTVTFPLTVLCEQGIILRGGRRIEVDVSLFTEDGVRKCFHYGLGRFLKDGSPTSKEDPEALQVVAYALAKVQALQGEKPLQERSRALPNSVKVFRSIVVNAAKRRGVKLDKLPDTLEGIAVVALKHGFTKASIVKARKVAEAADADLTLE